MIVNFVMLLTVLLGCCALALDIGTLEMDTLQMQNAADAAARGILLEQERGDPSGAAAAGYADAKLNGFQNGVNGVTINVYTPPALGAFTTNQSAVQVVITQQVESVLMGQSIILKTQATAVAPPCGYLMAANPSYPSLLLAGGNLSASCPTYIGRNLSVSALSIAQASAFYVVGSSSLSIFSSISPAPVFNYPVMSDPLTYLVSPTFSLPCTYLGLNILVPTTLSPGTYCGQAGGPAITIAATTVTFNPGLYIIAGGMTAGAATLNGSGVTLYMTSGPSTGYGQLLFTGTTVNLSAPATSGSGGIPGILVFGDRNWVSATPQDIKLTGCSFTGDGIVYFPRTGLYDSLCPIQAPHYFGMVIDNLSSPVGTIHLNSNFSSVAGGNPFHPQESLVE